MIIQASGYFQVPTRNDLLSVGSEMEISSDNIEKTNLLRNKSLDRLVERLCLGLFGGLLQHVFLLF